MGRLGKQHNAAGALILLSSSLKSAEICKPLCFFTCPLKWNTLTYTYTSPHLTPLPLSCYMCFIDHKVVARIAAVVRCHCFFPDGAASQTTQETFILEAAAYSLQCCLNIAFFFFCSYLNCPWLVHSMLSIQLLFIHPFCSCNTGYPVEDSLHQLTDRSTF